jgi:glycosyltransferase involved in cell wall biosynthesis
MRILQVSTADIAGGAERVAWQLMQGYRHEGHTSWMAVGEKYTQDPGVYPMLHDPARTGWCRWCLAVASRLAPSDRRKRSARWLHRALALGLGQPGRAWHRWQGKEDFEFPATSLLDRITPTTPDIIHCHNLHGSWLPDGGYFDLAGLPHLSRRYPLVLTLHDAWLLSGHCAHSFECERWMTGCGSCPDLTIYPAVRRDATAYNWSRKKAIYAASRVYVATPSQWLMDKVGASMLSPAVVDSCVIPNGVDLSVFAPAEKLQARARLNLPADAKIVLFAANRARTNIWKDYRLLQAAATRVAAELRGKPVRFVVLGDGASMENAESALVQFVPHQTDPETMARYYQAADVYAHAARADTFPLTVLEASACATPVVATAVGGIPEQIEDGRTGLLVTAGDVEAMAQAVKRLIQSDHMRRMFGEEAAALVRRRFGLSQQVRRYLAWYERILSHQRSDVVCQRAC